MIINAIPYSEELKPRDTNDVKYIVLCPSGDSKPQAVHFFVEKSGRIYQYRPLNAKVDYEKDDCIIVIGFQGNFYEESMSCVQEDAAVMLIAVLSLLYDNAMVLAHQHLEDESLKNTTPTKNRSKFPFGRLNRKVDVCKNNLRTLFGEPKNSNAYRALWQLIEDTPSIRSAGLLKTFTVNDVRFEMVKVAGGTFWMGAQTDPSLPCYDEEAARSPLATICLGEQPPHRVSVSDYYLGKTVVTNALWREVMGAVPGQMPEKDLPEHWAELPVECVSWDDCQEFIRKLNALTNQVFRLPTEAEWEYAAKGGNYSHHYMFAGSDCLDDVALVSNAARNQTYPIKSKLPNELGLYDMTGNVWEWCDDWYVRYDNPGDPSKRKVLRGGGWVNHPFSYRNTNRELAFPNVRYRRFGLRLALSSVFNNQE